MTRNARRNRARRAARQQGGGGSGSAAVQSCPRQQQQQQQQACSLDSLAIECSHGRLVDVPLAGPAPQLSVVASSSDTDKIKTRLGGSCGQGSPNCPEIHVTGGYQGATDERGSSPLEFDATIPSDRQGDLGWPRFLKEFLFPLKAEPVTYRVMGQTCDGQQADASVAAYPAIGWKGKVSVEYSFEAEDDSESNKDRGFAHLKPQGQWKMEGELVAKVNEREYKLGGSREKEGGAKDENRVAKGLFEGMQGFLNKLTPMLGDLKSDYGTIQIEWPKLSLGGEIETKEISGKPDIGIEGKVKLGFDPLLGANFETDILNWIIKIAGDYAGGFGSWLVTAKKKAAEYSEGRPVKAALQLLFTAGGSIGGSFEFERKAGGGWSISGSEVSGKVTFSLEGKALVEGRVFNVRGAAGASIIAGGAEGYGPGEVTATIRPLVKGSDPEVMMDLATNGLAIYYAYYWEVGAQSFEPGTEEETATRSRGDDPMAKSKGSFSNKFENKFVEIFGPASWPTKPAAVPVSAGVGP